MFPYHNLPVMLFQAMNVMIYPPPSFPYPFISDFLGYPIAPTDASLCHCPIKISISFYCHYKCHDMLLSLQMSVLIIQSPLQSSKLFIQFP